MTPEEFRRAGHELIDWVADYRERVARAEFPVMARTTPGALRAALPSVPPQAPEEFAAIRRDLDALILPACTHWQDPRFHGYFPSNGLPAAVLGDLVSTGLGQLGLNWQSSPALTELEEVCLDWWRQMLGLSERWSGVIQDTASTATFVALVCARERASNHDAARGIRARERGGDSGRREFRHERQCAGRRDRDRSRGRARALCHRRNLRQHGGDGLRPDCRDRADRARRG